MMSGASTGSIDVSVDVLLEFLLVYIHYKVGLLFVNIFTNSAS